MNSKLTKANQFFKRTGVSSFVLCGAILGAGQEAITYTMDSARLGSLNVHMCLYSSISSKTQTKSNTTHKCYVLTYKASIVRVTDRRKSSQGSVSLGAELISMHTQKGS